MNSFDLKIVTLDGLAYAGEAISVVARTTVGDVCILNKHADYVGAIDIGKVKIKTQKETRLAACAGGFISVSNNKVRIVATTFEFADEIDENRAMKAKEKAEMILSKAKSEKEQKMAGIKLKKALLRLEISSGRQQS